METLIAEQQVSESLLHHSGVRQLATNATDSAPPSAQDSTSGIGEVIPASNSVDRCEPLPSAELPLPILDTDTETHSAFDGASRDEDEITTSGEDSDERALSIRAADSRHDVPQDETGRTTLDTEPTMLTADIVESTNNTTAALVIAYPQRDTPDDLFAIEPTAGFSRAREAITAYEAGIEALPVEGRALGITSRDVTANDTAYRLDESQFSMICSQMAAPGSYVAGLPSYLQRFLFAHHLRDKFGEAEVAYLLAKDGSFVGLRDSRLLSLSAIETFDAVADALGGGAFRVAGLRWPMPNIVEFEFVARSGFEVAVGDNIEVGVKVTHPIDGSHATWIVGYALRLVCSNGMVARVCSGERGPDGKRRLGARTRRLPASASNSRDHQLDQIRRLVAQETEAVGAKLDDLRHLPSQHVHVEALFGEFLRRARLRTGCAMR